MQFIPVSQVLEELKNTLHSQFPSIYVTGEVSNFMRASSGHYYFTLSDPQASLSVVLFRSSAIQLPILDKIKNGDKIFCAGGLTLYPKRGQLQMNAQYVHSCGTGVLKMRYDLLKKQLAAQGYFDLERKKSLPKIPQRVALITSPTGAAVHDFLNVYQARSFHMDVIIVGALVQGEKSAQSLRSALKKAMKLPGIDVIVFTRGGGSFEDLYSFNDEELIKEIYACPIPIVSAIGHQVDFTLCDYVCDVRAQTPTAAAQLLTLGSVEILETLRALQRRLQSQSQRILLHYQNVLFKARPIRMLGHIQNQAHRYHNRLESARAQMIKRMEIILTRWSHSLEKYAILLRSNDPHLIWQRGIVWVENSKGQALKTRENFIKDQYGPYTLRFVDGNAIVDKKD